MGATMKESELREDATGWRRRGPIESAEYLARTERQVGVVMLCAVVAMVVLAVGALAYTVVALVS